MLKKSFSLSQKEILEVLRKGNYIAGEGFYIKYIQGTEFHFAFSISTKVSKKAVVRNTIKRKFKAAIFSLLKNNELESGSYFFVIKNEKLKSKQSMAIEDLIRNAILK